MIPHLLAGSYYSGKLVGVLKFQKSVPPLVYNSKTRRGVVLPSIVQLQNSSGSCLFDYCTTETCRGVVLPTTYDSETRRGVLLTIYCATRKLVGELSTDYCTTGKLVGELFYRLLYDPKTRWGVYYALQDLEVRRDLISKQLFETLRLGKTRHSFFYRKVAMTIKFLWGSKITNVLPGAVRFGNSLGDDLKALVRPTSWHVFPSCRRALRVNTSSVLLTIQLGNYSAALQLSILRLYNSLTIRTSARCYQDYEKN